MGLTEWGRRSWIGLPFAILFCAKGGSFCGSVFH